MIPHTDIDLFVEKLQNHLEKDMSEQRVNILETVRCDSDTPLVEAKFDGQPYVFNSTTNWIEEHGWRISGIVPSETKVLIFFRPIGTSNM